MTARVISDPSALGWEYDSETGRWSWGGGQGGSGGGNGTFPEAPVDGEQYARQNAGWSIIEHPDSGVGTVTTADVKLTNPTLRSPIGLDTQEDANKYFVGELGKLIDEDGNVIGGGDGGIPDAPADSVIYGRKNNDWVAVPTSGGGDGPDMSAYYTAAQCDTKFHPKGTYDNYVSWNVKVNNGTAMAVGKGATLDFVGSGSTTVSRTNGVITISSTSPSLNGYATETWVSANYQVKGNYLTSFTESDPVFKASPAGGITSADITNWNGKSSYTGSDAVKLTGAQTIAGRKVFSDRIETSSGVIAGGNISGSGWIQVTGECTASKFIGDGSALTNLPSSSYTAGNGISISSNQIAMKGSYTGNFSATGTITGTDCIATSDERLKKDVEVVKTGLVTQLDGVEFNWVQSDTKSSGVIAQRVKEIPELEHLVHYNDDQGHYGVSYICLIPYLLEEIKALNSRVEELENG